MVLLPYWRLGSQVRGGGLTGWASVRIPLGEFDFGQRAMQDLQGVLPLAEQFSVEGTWQLDAQLMTAGVVPDGDGFPFVPLSRRLKSPGTGVDEGPLPTAAVKQ